MEYTIEGDRAVLMVIMTNWNTRGIMTYGAAGDDINALTKATARELIQAAREVGNDATLYVVWPANADGYPQVESREIDDIDPLTQCDNCGLQTYESELEEIDESTLHERMDDDGPTPSGDCPECGAFCYPVTNEDDAEVTS